MIDTERLSVMFMSLLFIIVLGVGLVMKLISESTNKILDRLDRIDKPNAEDFKWNC